MGNATVVLCPSVSRAPAEGRYTPAEAVLVDLFLERDRLGLMDAEEFMQMAGALLESGRVPLGTLVEHAQRRKVDWLKIVDYHVIN